MTDATPDPAASALEGIRNRADAATKAEAQLVDAAIEASATQVPEVAARPAILARLASSFDVPRLLKAVEAALKLADDLDAEAARLLATAARLKTGAATGTQNRAWAHRDCAKAIREAITAALAGKEADDE